jgi:hypothetical protein
VLFAHTDEHPLALRGERAARICSVQVADGKCFVYDVQGLALPSAAAPKEFSRAMLAE